jgi:hypothetical protein
MTVKPRSIRNAAALAVAVSALAAAPASAGPLAASTGSFSTPPLPAVGDVTLKLGPLGQRSLDGVRDVRVTVRWDNLVGQLTHVAGTACQVDQALVANAGARLDMAIVYSYTRDKPAPQPDEVVSQTVQLVKQNSPGENWEFGVCYDSLG